MSFYYLTFVVCFVYLYMSISKVLDPEVSYQAVENLGVSALFAFVKSGVKYTAFSKFVHRTPFTLSDWAAFLHLSERTMQRYEKDKKSFDAMQSEKIIQIAMLYKKGMQVFGSNSSFDTWLITQNISLGNNTPKSFFDTSIGVSIVMDELLKIEHGILA